MGMQRFGRVLKIPIYGSAAGFGAFSIWANKSTIAPLPLSDPLFESSFYHRYNPERNQAVRDTCVRFVPLDDIDPLLLEEDGRLVQAFAAGFWSGPGYAVQLTLLSLLFQGPDTAHQLWSREELRNSNYDVGVQITNHFEVLEKTSGSILFRGGDSPANSGLRSTDGSLN
ncbi:Lanosterol 14-alpha-demethylase [Rhinocladiella similis]